MTVGLKGLRGHLIRVGDEHHAFTTEPHRARDIRSYEPLLNDAEAARFLGGLHPKNGTAHGSDTERAPEQRRLLTSALPQFEALLSDSQAGELLGLHAKTVQRLARSGDIPAIRIGRYWRFRASELNDWLETLATGRKKPVESAGQPVRNSKGVN